MLEQPPVQYAQSGALHIAYQVVGEGPIDIVEVPGMLNHLEVMWETPGLVRFIERLARLGRVILFDKRGMGLSDRLPHDATPTTEERADDVRAVMDAAGSAKAVLLGVADGGVVAMQYAAMYPERVQALVLHSTGPCGIRKADFPYGPDAALAEQLLRRVERDWGTGIMARALGDRSDAAAEFFGRVERRACPPRAAAALMRIGFDIDVRHLLPAIRVPTLIVHHRDHPAWPVGGARYLAEHIPGARLIVQESPFSLLVEFSERRGVTESVEEFLTGAPAMPGPERLLTVLLFTDIVGSTGRAAALGDRAWRDVLDDHDGVIRRLVEAAGGHCVKTTGDGVLARFDGAVRAIRCAQAIVAEVKRLGLAVRAGVHAGECERLGDDLAGIAVHVGARVAELAGAGEVLVSGTVRDLVLGAGIEFDDRGQHVLRGVPGTWPVLAVVR